MKLEQLHDAVERARWGLLDQALVSRGFGQSLSCGVGAHPRLLPASPLLWDSSQATSEDLLPPRIWSSEAVPHS